MFLQIKRIFVTIQRVYLQHSTKHILGYAFSFLGFLSMLKVVFCTLYLQIVCITFE